MQAQPLSAICTLITDGTHYTPPDIGTGIPFLTVKDIDWNGVLDLHASSKISEDEYRKAALGNCAPVKGDVLFSKDGTVGKVSVVRTLTPFAVLSSVAILRPDVTSVDPEYLAHALKSPDAIDQALRKKTGSAIRRIILSDLKNVRIPLPDLAEQRRIAAILDKADALRAKRREAIAKLDQLLQSVFLEMFATQHFDTVNLQELLPNSSGSIRTGPFGSQLLHDEFVDSGIAVLGIDNAVRNSFAWGKPRFITEQKFRELARYRVIPGDVLITIMGTCGRCAVVPNDIPVAINTKHLCCITLDRTKCEPEFLHSYFLMHPVALRFLADRAKGAIMSGLNMGIVRELPVELPPLERQKKFVQIKRRLLDAGADASAQQNHVGRLMNALQQQAFSGAL